MEERHLPTDPKQVTGVLSTWLADLQYEDVPASAIDRGKYLILDGIGCALVGAKLPWSQRAFDVISKMEANGAGTVAGHGHSISTPAAVLLNGTFIQAFELDDYHYLAPIHSNAVVLPPLLGAVDVLEGISGKTFLLGAVAGYEVGPRVGMALHGMEMLSRGWHSGAVFGTHAAAAAAGKLFGLHPARFEDALGIAGTQSGGLMAAQFEAMVKRMHHGFAARSGFYAVSLAAGGYTGIKRVFERDYGGFLAAFGEGHSPDASKVVEDLGSVWETERISVKPYAAMTAHHSTIDAVFELRAKRPFTAEEVERVDVGIGHAAYHHGWWDLKRPITETGAQMHIGYSTSVAIIDNAASVAQYTTRRIDSDDIWNFLPRVHAYHDPSVDAYPHEGKLRTRTRITLKNGEMLETEIAAPKGHHTRPLSNQDILDKFRLLTSEVLEPGRRSELEEMILGLDQLRDARDLVRLLAQPVGTLF